MHSLEYIHITNKLISTVDTLTFLKLLIYFCFVLNNERMNLLLFLFFISSVASFRWKSATNGFQRREICHMSKLSEISDLKNVASELEASIQKLKTQISKEEESLQNIETNEDLVRVTKEFVRMQERAIERQPIVTNNAIAEAFTDILPIIDNYRRARQVHEIDPSPNKLKALEKYDGVFESILTVAKEFGITTYSSLGLEFDVHFMEALMSSPSRTIPFGFVCQEYRQGYLMANKCLEPSLVVVSSGAEGVDAESNVDLDPNYNPIPQLNDDGFDGINYDEW